jgi:hypothetical protein
MTLQQLAELKASGRSHHAIYRDYGTIWEGLYIYRKAEANDPTGFRGFVLEACFGKNDPNLPAAEDLLRGTGISFGAFGEG